MKKDKVCPKCNGIGHLVDYPIITIRNKAITINAKYVILKNKSKAISELETIVSNAKDEDVLFIKVAKGHTIIIKHGTGNIYLSGQTHFVMDSSKMGLNLGYSANLSRWCEFARAVV